jgi:release factor glutamine methyltransferase
MTFREFLSEKAKDLGESDTPFLDASILMAEALHMPRSRLLATLSEEMDGSWNDEVVLRFESWWARRRGGESVAAILGRKEFYGREFRINAKVLVPRPDTETLVVAALECGDSLEIQNARPVRVHDVCTGSGVVAITLAAERPLWVVSASDISIEAIDVARGNSCAILGRVLDFRVADLFQGFENPGFFEHGFDIVTANPPYLTRAETDGLLEKGWKEPRLALDGGEDGMDIVRTLVGQAIRMLKPGGFLLIETDSLQSSLTRDILVREGFGQIRVWKDLSGLDRITGGRVPWRLG